MRIVIKNSDKDFKIALPTRLILNSLTATVVLRMINKKIKKYGNEDKPIIKGSQLRPLLREINRYRRKHKDWVLVEVENEGDKVVIKP